MERIRTVNSNSKQLIALNHATLCETLRILCELCGWNNFTAKARRELAKDREEPEKVNREPWQLTFAVHSSRFTVHDDGPAFRPPKLRFKHHLTKNPRSHVVTKRKSRGVEFGVPCVFVRFAGDFGGKLL